MSPVRWLFAGVSLYLPMGATAAHACPWHSLGDRSIAQGTAGGGWALFPALYVFDRLASRETRVDLAAAAPTVPALHGVACKVVPPKDDDLSDTYRVTCDQGGRMTELVHSCKGDDAEAARVWNAEDRRGMTVVTVVLGCERTQDAEDDRA